MRSSNREEQSNEARRGSLPGETGGAAMPEREALLFWSNALEAREIARQLADIGLRCEIRQYGDVRPGDAGRNRLVQKGVIPEDCLQVLGIYATANKVEAVRHKAGLSQSGLTRRLAHMRETLGCKTNRELILVAARLGLI